MAKRDYYEVLGVGKAASPDEIKKAFRSLEVWRTESLGEGTINSVESAACLIAPARLSPQATKMSCRAQFVKPRSLPACDLLCLSKRLLGLDMSGLAFGYAELAGFDPLQRQHPPNPGDFGLGVALAVAIHHFEGAGQ